MEYISFYISSFQILAPTPVGVQKSEDFPVPGMVLVAEGIRVPEDVRVAESVRVPENIRVPEIYEYSTEKNWNYIPDPTRPDLTWPEEMFHPHTPNN